MQVTRQQVTTAAVRAVAIWIIVQGVAAGVGSVVFLSRARSLGVSEQPSAQLLVMVAVIPLVGGMILWVSARWIAALVFRDQRSDERVLVPDLYRIAAAFAGVFLLSQSIPSVFVWLSTWVFSYTSGRSVFGSVGLDAHDRGLLFDVQTKAAIVGMVVQLVLGAVLLAAPGSIERAITNLRRDRAEPEFDREE
jgi:hypothetical protein